MNYEDQYLGLAAGEYEGLEVLVRSNEAEPLVKGTIISKIYHGSSSFWTVMTDDGKKIAPMGVVVPYTEEMYAFLRSLTATRQWEILSCVSLMLGALR